MLVGRLFHARATVTRNDRSPMVLSRFRGTISRVTEPKLPAMCSIQINDVSHFNSITCACQDAWLCIWASLAHSGSAIAYFILIAFQYIKLNVSK